MSTKTKSTFEAGALIFGLLALTTHHAPEANAQDITPNETAAAKANDAPRIMATRPLGKRKIRKTSLQGFVNRIEKTDHKACQITIASLQHRKAQQFNKMHCETEARSKPIRNLYSNRASKER